MNEELELTIQNLAFKEYIDSLVQENESVEIEFKSAKGGFPNSFWETYSAFANTEGGTIVLGIKEKGRTVHIEGLDKEQLHEYKTRFWRDVNNKQVINQNLLKEENVKEGEYQGKGLLVFSIPRATRTERPVHKAQNPLNGNTFKRNYEGDYRCTDQEVRRMPLDCKVSVPHGGVVHMPKASLSDLPRCREIVRALLHFFKRPAQIGRASCRERVLRLV